MCWRFLEPTNSSYTENETVKHKIEILQDFGWVLQSKIDCLGSSNAHVIEELDKLSIDNSHTISLVLQP